MRLNLSIVFLTILILCMGCSTSTSIAPEIIEPDPGPEMTAQIYWPETTGTIWENVDVSGYQEKFIEYGLDQLVIARRAQTFWEYDPDFIPDGTTMTPTQIVVTLTGELTAQNFGWGPVGNFTGCDVYVLMYWQLWEYEINSLPPPLNAASYWVWVMEFNGYDWPNEPTVFPCDECPDYQDIGFGEMVCYPLE